MGEIFFLTPKIAQPCLYHFPAQKKLRANLESAIEKVDLESALEAAAIDRGKGGPASKESLFVAPLQAGTRFTTPLVNSVCSIRFFSSAMVVYK